MYGADEIEKKYVFTLEIRVYPAGHENLQAIPQETGQLCGMLTDASYFTV
jgi:hypothetical protein